MGTDPTASAEFRQLYNATFDAVRRFCLRRLPASDVNDALSEVYLVAWRRFDEVPSDDKALPWLYAVARNVVRHIDRSNRRRHRLTAKALRQPTVTVPSTDVVVVRRAEDEESLRALNELSATDREVVLLRAWEGLSAPEIATALGISRAATEKRLSRATHRLERLIGEGRAPTAKRSMTAQEETR